MMSTRSKDDIRSTCTCCNKKELKTINFVFQKKSIPDPVHSDLSIKRDLENPEDLIVHIKHGEGQRPIFDRNDIRVNEERRVILMDVKQSYLKENENNEQNQHCSKSSEVGNNSLNRENLGGLIPSERSNKRSRSSEGRTISTQNCETFFQSDVSPHCRNICSTENVVEKHHRSNRSTSRTRSFRSKSPCTSDRHRSLKRKSHGESNREYERYKKRSKHRKRSKLYSRSPSPSFGKENLRGDSISSDKSEDRRSHSGEHSSPENSFRWSYKFPNKSEKSHKLPKKKIPTLELIREYGRNEKLSRRYHRSLSPSYKRSKRYDRSLSPYKDRSVSHSPSLHKVKRHKSSHRRRSPSPNEDKRSHRKFSSTSPTR